MGDTLVAEACAECTSLACLGQWQECLATLQKLEGQTSNHGKVGGMFCARAARLISSRATTKPPAPAAQLNHNLAIAKFCAGGAKDVDGLISQLASLQQVGRMARHPAPPPALDHISLPPTMLRSMCAGNLWGQRSRHRQQQRSQWHWCRARGGGGGA